MATKRKETTTCNTQLSCPTPPHSCVVTEYISKTDNDHLIPHQTRTASTMHSMTWFHLTTMSIFPFKQIPIFNATQPPTKSMSTNQSIASTIILDRDVKREKM